jgi:hypothetical protein
MPPAMPSPRNRNYYQAAGGYGYGYQIAAIKFPAATEAEVAVIRKALGLPPESTS